MTASLLAAALLLQAAPPPADPAAAVAGTLDRLHETAARGDGDAYFALFAPEARFIGTDASEHWDLPAFHRYADPGFAKRQGWTYRPHDRTVTIAPIDCRCVAWFDEKLSHADYGELRGSGVLRLVNGEWTVAQYALSFTVPNDAVDRVQAAIRAKPQE